MDATLGAAGHATHLLQALPPPNRLLGLDRDPAALAIARKRLQDFKKRVRILPADFRRLADVLKDIGESRIAGILFDLGLSSMQLDDAERGFSYLQDGPLDMRADSAQQLTAEIIINEYAVEDLSRIFYEYGEERRSRAVARRIEKFRSRQRITTTGELAELLKPVLAPPHYYRSLARIWMALRIAVNGELSALAEGLAAGVSALDVGGRVVVLAYHSLEDRIVKSSFKEWSRQCGCSPALGPCTCGAQPLINVLTRRPRRPAAAEVSENTRARAARLRAAEKIVPGTVRPLPLPLPLTLPLTPLDEGGK